jgi:hypothetical protein
MARLSLIAVSIACCLATTSFAQGQNLQIVGGRSHLRADLRRSVRTGSVRRSPAIHYEPSTVAGPEFWRR